MSDLMKYISRLFSACGTLLNLHGGEKESGQDVQVRSNIVQTSIKHPTLTGVSKSRYFGISIPIKYSNFSRFIKKWVHFIKKSDVISFVIDQSQPGVFYLQKMMNFMKPGVFYLQKMMNFMKMRTFYKKLPLFIKNSILHTYKKLKPQI